MKSVNNEKGKLAMPLVSVIMSVYNTKNYEELLNSVNSILAQTFKDFEFIICDDGSTFPETKKYLKKLEELDSRIRIIGYDNNRGLAYSRNECLKYCNGKYIALQDDDDISEPQRLQKEIDFFKKNPGFSFVGTNANIIDHSGIIGKYEVPQFPTKIDFLWNSPFINPTVMFKKSVLKTINGYNTSKMVNRVEDYELFFRLYANGYEGYNIQKNLFNYRIEIEKEKRRKYRSIKDRFHEAYVRARGYKELHLFFRGIPFVIKPILISMIPSGLFYRIRKNEFKR